MNILNRLKRYRAPATEPFSNEAFQKKLERLYVSPGTKKKTTTHKKEFRYSLTQSDFSIRVSQTLRTKDNLEYALKIVRANDKYMTCLPTPYFTTGEQAKLAFDTMQWLNGNAPLGLIAHAVRQNNWRIRYRTRTFDDIDGPKTLESLTVYESGIHIEITSVPTCQNLTSYNAWVVCDVQHAPLPRNLHINGTAASKQLFNLLHKVYIDQQQNQGK